MAFLINENFFSFEFTKYEHIVFCKYLTKHFYLGFKLSLQQSVQYLQYFKVCISILHSASIWTYDV